MASVAHTAPSAAPTAGAHAISIEGAAKIYRVSGGAPVEALRPTHLDLQPGEFVSLVGPSGCGKTTLLKLISGLDDITSGRVAVGDRIVTKPDPSVSVVFQRPALLKWYTVEQNVLLPAKVAGTLTKEVRQRAIDLLDFIGLGDFRHRYPSELSGGMQQRTAIVRALAGEPQVLLMDEPFSALDEFTREVLHDELLRLWSEHPKTVIFVTHNIAEAVYLSDRVAVMAPRPGRIEQIVDIELDRPRTPELRTDPRFFELVSDIRSCFHQAGALGGND
ncbi:ABC transporter ATP-binding protein [Aeromicrobium sp. YIM 150415]|uniref:ABC transporter ATP-binding protein n=1 Tax=Aeromicrobium sp. YIM 150415 TaxID=2803912 RepID=UPI001966A085|nr:ABC transporter ATP-binding protein [Aeromicrobium sp. YIM 150415]MBM9463475.1 ABC transporter ATP-binding protein [Aeromicrobium sp. YIM 150415]